MHGVGRHPPARSKCCPYSPEVARPVGTACSSRWRRTLVEPVGETSAHAEWAFESRHSTEPRRRHWNLENEARVASQTLHLFLHAILMVAVRQVEANGIGEVEVDLVDEAVPFPQLAQHLLFLVLSCQRQQRWQGDIRRLFHKSCSHRWKSEHDTPSARKHDRHVFCMSRVGKACCLPASRLQRRRSEWLTASLREVNSFWQTDGTSALTAYENRAEPDPQAKQSTNDRVLTASFAFSRAWAKSPDTHAVALSSIMVCTCSSTHRKANMRGTRR